MENQQKKIFANCSQTVRSHCEFRNVFANHFRIAKSDTPVHCSIAKFFLSQNLCEISHCEIHNEFASQIRNAKISQSQFRNAKANFAMPKPNSQCQNTVHVSQPMRNFALRNSQPTLRISQTHFALRNSLPFAKFTFAGLVILCN